MTCDPSITTAIASIRTALAGYTFRVRSEAELQVQVVAALTAQLPKSHIETEVMRGSGRFDVVLKLGWDDSPMRWCRYVTIVLELKVKSSAAAVERQAQRYALMDDVDAVLVVTTSSRLAIDLAWHGDSLGGKPFGAISVRTS